MPTHRKKLIEVALPLEAINKAAAREKSIRHGHPSTLHLWWARRPLAACRAVLFGQLVDDPSSWPERFKSEEAQGAERKRLHDFIAELVKWENSNDERVLNRARWYIARSLAWGRGEEPPGEGDPEAVRRYLLDHAPPVYDPFCGGGSIPLEAQRLGLRAYGSDLNPVAVMISKALVEFPPTFAGLPPVNPEARRKLANGGAGNAKGAQGLAEDVRYYGRWMRDEAKKRIGHLYPDVELPDGSQATVIAWLWARTVASPNPACRGAHVPLVSSFMLSTKDGKEAWVEPVLDRAAHDGYRFEVRNGKADAAALEKAKKGTKASRGAHFVCALTGTPITPDHIRIEGKAKRMGARLMTIVAEGQRGRVYLPPDEDHERIAASAEPIWAPQQEMVVNSRYMTPTIFGFRTFADLFTPRQLMALATFSDLVLEARAKALEDARAAGMDLNPIPLAEGGAGAQAYSDGISLYLAFATSKVADRNSSVVGWAPGREHARNTFTRQALSMLWDFAESNCFSDSSGNFEGGYETIANAVSLLNSKLVGLCVIADAASHDPIDGSLISTDPPYYDNVPYADLSDFFYVWLRPILHSSFQREFSTVLVPKQHELVAEPARHGGSHAAEDFFLGGMTRAISRMVRASDERFPTAIYYAFKQAEVESEGVLSTGWATFLEAVTLSDYQVDGTWPVRTELARRVRG